MQTVVGVRGTVVILLIYAACGYPEISKCLENGGPFVSCTLAGGLIGGLKVGVYIFGNAIIGLLHLFQ
jgi:hypothetical protein